MTENIKKLQELLDCEVIPVAQNTDPRQLVETYLNLLNGIDYKNNK